jgi:hypothetical protein
VRKVWEYRSTRSSFEGRNGLQLRGWRANCRAAADATRGGSRMRESRTYGSMRGALSNEGPYRNIASTDHWRLGGEAARRSRSHRDPPSRKQPREPLMTISTGRGLCKYGDSSTIPPIASALEPCGNRAPLGRTLPTFVSPAPMRQPRRQRLSTRRKVSSATGPD